MPPPRILRKRTAARTRSRSETKHEPTGAPSPFEKHTLTESNGAASSRTGIPVATDAFHRRAPSRWRPSPLSRATRAIASTSFCGNTRPPPRFWVFSTATSEVRG